ncbi:MAG: hypothetical protein QF371_07115 [Flavobacteriales bacterium]|nr:hypothetical protein [Flavobacteriales bacterium]
MTQDQFYTWMENPSTMNADSVRALRDITERYPYFQAAQMMLAKNLKQENHIDQLNQLHLAAVCVPDRKVFYDYMHDKKRKELISPVKPLVDKEQESKPEVVEVKTTHLLPDELIPEPIIYQLEKAELPDIPIQEEKDAATKSEPEELSFSEWLAYMRDGKAEQNQHQPKVPKTKQVGKSKVELIDQFLSDEPRKEIKKRAEFFNPQKAASKSMEEDFTVVSETLAKIYEKQQKYELAIQAYQALSLKYPEKSTYFAARLKELDGKLNTES